MDQVGLGPKRQRMKRKGKHILEAASLLVGTRAVESAVWKAKCQWVFRVGIEVQAKVLGGWSSVDKV